MPLMGEALRHPPYEGLNPLLPLPRSVGQVRSSGLGVQHRRHMPIPALEGYRLIGSDGALRLRRRLSQESLPGLGVYQSNVIGARWTD